MIRLLAACLLLTGPAAARAESFSIDSAVSHGLRHNPELVAARHRIAEAEGRLLRAGQRAAPEIEAEVKPNMEGGEFAASIGLVQKLPLAQRLRLEKRVSAAEVAVAVREVEAAERALALEIRTAAVKMLGVRSRREVQQRRAAHSRELAAAAARAAAAGEGSSLAAGEMELETGEIEVRELELKAEEIGLADSLRPLLGLPPTAAVLLTGTLSDPVAPRGSASPQVDSLSDYQAAQARYEAATENVALQMASKWEDISVGINYEREQTEDAPYGLRRDNILGLKVTIPLPVNRNNLSHIREAEAAARRREAEREAVAARLRAEAAAARSAMAAAAAVFAHASGTLLPKARQLEDRYLAAYQAAQAPLTDVLRSRERRLALELARLDAQRDFHLARIRYEAAMGR